MPLRQPLCMSYGQLETAFTRTHAYIDDTLVNVVLQFTRR